MRSLMKQVIAVVLCVVLAATQLPAEQPEAAKKLKLSRKTLSIEVGSTATIKLKNAVKKTKVTWKTSNKSVAELTKKKSKGKKASVKVLGVSKGTAKVTAVYKQGGKKKKLSCSVTVKEPVNIQMPQSQTQSQTQPQPLTPVNPQADNKIGTPAPTQYVPPMYTDPVNPAPTDKPATEAPATDEPTTEVPATEAPKEDTLTISAQSDVEKVLKKAVADPDITKVKIVTDEATEIVLPEGDYSSVELIVEAPLADISNHALFKNITINEIAEDTYREYANGNNIDVNCANGRIIVTEDAFSAVNILKDSSKVRVVVDGQVSAINVDAKDSEVDISGSAQEIINVNVSRESEIRSSHILNVKTLVKITYVVYPGAEDSKFLVKNEELIPDVYGIGSVQVSIEITGDVITVVAEYRDDVSDQQRDVLLEGSIVDEYENAVEGATVYVVPYTNAFDEADIENNPYLKKAVTDATGTYRINPIRTGNYIMVVKEESMVTAIQYLIITSSYGNVFRNETLQLFPKEPNGNPGMIRGILSDSLNGRPIEGLTARLRQGRGNTTGDILARTVSDAQGEYTFENVEPGYYTVEFVDLRTGVFDKKYITTSVNAVVRAGETAVVSAALTEGVKNSQIRFVLNWGDETSGASADLDSHLLGPDATGTGRFHTYFDDMEYYDYESGIMYADLDYDDTEYEGPETTTVYEPVSGVYDFYIHNYSERENYYSRMLAQSSAKVDIYQGGRLILTYYPPNRDGTVWYVCSYDSNTGVFTEKSEMSYEEYPEYVGSGSAVRPTATPTEGTGPTATPTDVSGPTARPTREPTSEPTATPIPTPTNEPYEKDIDISSVVPINPTDADNCLEYNLATGTLTARNLEGILVPIGEDVVPDETVAITIYGSAKNASSDAQIRTWLSDAQNPYNSNYSEIQNPAEWGRTYLYTALDVASGIQIKKVAYDAENFKELIITRITVKKSWRDPKPEITETPTPTSTPLPDDEEYDFEVPENGIPIDVSTYVSASGTGAYNADKKKVEINDTGINDLSQGSWALPEDIASNIKTGDVVTFRVQGYSYGDSGFRFWLGSPTSCGCTAVMLLNEIDPELAIDPALGYPCAKDMDGDVVVGLPGQEIQDNPDKYTTYNQMAIGADPDTKAFDLTLRFKAGTSQDDVNAAFTHLTLKYIYSGGTAGYINGLVIKNIYYIDEESESSDIVSLDLSNASVPMWQSNPGSFTYLDDGSVELTWSENADDYAGVTLDFPAMDISEYSYIVIDAVGDNMTFLVQDATRKEPEWGNPLDIIQRYGQSFPAVIKIDESEFGNRVDQYGDPPDFKNVGKINFAKGTDKTAKKLIVKSVKLYKYASDIPASLLR